MKCTEEGLDKYMIQLRDDSLSNDLCTRLPAHNNNNNQPYAQSQCKNETLTKVWREKKLFPRKVYG